MRIQKRTQSLEYKLHDKLGKLHSSFQKNLIFTYFIRSDTIELMD